MVFLASALLLKNWLSSGVEVQLATATLTSPSQSQCRFDGGERLRSHATQSRGGVKGTGTLVFLAVDEGDRVKKGQLIARLDDSDVAASLRRARKLRVAEADLDEAKINFERMQKLVSTRRHRAEPISDAR